MLELCSPGHVNEDEQDGVKDREKEDRKETERQTKFKLKFKVIYLHSPLSRASLKGLKGTDKKRKRKTGTKKRRRKNPIISN